MPYTSNALLPLIVSGKILLTLNVDTDPLYSQVADSGSPWLLGSTFAIEETWEIRTRIIEPKLVQVFREYAFDRYKLGNWEIVSADNVPRSNKDSSGYLHRLVERISVTSYLTIGIPQVGATINNGIEEIDNCNFATREITLGFGGTSVSFQSPATDRSLFKTRKTARAAILRDFSVKRQAPRLGIYLFPGVELTDASYQMAIINLAPVQVDQFAADNCSALDPNCDDEFLTFRNDRYPGDAQYPNGFADGQDELREGTHIFSSTQAALSTLGYSQGEQTFICSNGQTRTYDTANAP